MPAFCTIFNNILIILLFLLTKKYFCVNIYLGNICGYDKDGVFLKGSQRVRGR